MIIASPLLYSLKLKKKVGFLQISTALVTSQTVVISIPSSLNFEIVIHHLLVIALVSPSFALQFVVLFFSLLSSASVTMCS